MMDIFYRSTPPEYRGSCPAPPPASNGLLSSVWCNLFGGRSVPSYRTPDGTSSAAAPPVSRCWWQLSPSAPSYKTPPVDVLEVDASDPSQDGEAVSCCEYPADVVDGDVYLE